MQCNIAQLWTPATTGAMVGQGLGDGLCYGGGLGEATDCFQIPSPFSSHHTKFLYNSDTRLTRASQVAIVVKNLRANVRYARDVGLIPGSRRSPEGGHGNPLQNSCLENPVDRGAWWPTEAQRVGCNLTCIG